MRKAAHALVGALALLATTTAATPFPTASVELPRVRPVV